MQFQLIVNQGNQNVFPGKPGRSRKHYATEEEVEDDPDIVLYARRPVKPTAFGPERNQSIAFDVSDRRCLVERPEDRLTVASLRNKPGEDKQSNRRRQRKAALLGRFVKYAGTMAEDCLLLKS